jgi:hypothetical protein
MLYIRLQILLKSVGTLLVMNIASLREKGFSEVSSQNIYFFDQLAISTNTKKTFYNDGQELHLCIQNGKDEKHNSEILDIALEMLGDDATISVNHRDLFEGLLLAIGVNDVNTVAKTISDYANQPLKIRMGMWRQLLVEAQIRYLETLMNIEHPAVIKDKFVLNPQAQKGVSAMKKLFDSCKNVKLDFSMVCDANQELMFKGENEKYIVTGAHLSTPPCVGFKFTKK